MLQSEAVWLSLAAVYLNYATLPQVEASAALDESQKDCLQNFSIALKSHTLAFAGNWQIFHTVKEEWGNQGHKGHNPDGFSGLPGRQLFPTWWYPFSALEDRKPSWIASVGAWVPTPAAAKYMVHISPEARCSHSLLHKPAETTADGVHFNFKITSLHCCQTEESKVDLKKSSLWEMEKPTFKADWSHRKYTNSITKRGKKKRDASGKSVLRQPRWQITHRQSRIWSNMNTHDPSVKGHSLWLMSCLTFRPFDI